MHEGGRANEVRLLLDPLPGVHQRGELALDRLGRDVLADRADDDAAGVVGKHSLDEGTQSLSFFAVADLATHADARRERHVDEEAAGHGDLRGDARALRGDRLLADLDEQLLAALEHVLDGGSVALVALQLAEALLAVIIVVVPGVIGIDEIGGVEKGTLIGADVDERGLKARKNCVYLSEVDVAHHTAGIGAIDEKLNELVVLEDGDPGLPLGRIDQDLSFHQGPRLAVPPATRWPWRGGYEYGWLGRATEDGGGAEPNRDGPPRHAA